MTTQLEFTERSAAAGNSQRARIEAHLRAHAGQWIPMPELARIGADNPNGFCIVHSRISDINRGRRRDGLAPIEHQNRWVGGQCHSSYRWPLAL